MKNRESAWGITITVAIILPIVLGLVFVLLSASQTGGRLVYFMDDAYIHMGIARNYLLHGSLGINETGWTNLTSSPFYTFLLILLLKVSDMSDQILWPLAMAAWAGLAWTMGLAFRHLGYERRSYHVYILLLLGCLPFSYVFLHGMEHILHVWFTSLLLMYWQGPVDGQKDVESPQYLGIVSLLTVLAVLTRFETIFLTGTLFLMDVWERRYRRAVALVLATGIPPLAFMGWMAAHGADFVPASVSVKSTLNTSSLRLLGRDLFIRVTRNIGSVDKFWLFTGAVAVAWPVKWMYLREDNRAVRPLLAAVVCAVAGILLTPMDMTNRYEMWLFGLMAFGAIAFGRTFSRKEIRWSIAAALPLLVTLAQPYYKGSLPLLYGSLVLALLFAPLLYWGLKAGRKAWMVPVSILLLTGMISRYLMTAPNVAHLGENIYGQQQTFARFLKTYYNGQTVVLNDIGTTAFYTDCPIVDRAGLATQAMVPAVKRLNQGHKKNFGSALDSVAVLKNAKLAVVYAAWLKGMVPPRWIPVGTLTTPAVLGLLGDEIVTFYAFTPGDAAAMKRNLKQFQPQVPQVSKLEILP